MLLSVIFPALLVTWVHSGNANLSLMRFRQLISPGNKRMAAPEDLKPEDWPTVKPKDPFDPKRDAYILYYAMKGMGTTESDLIDVLCYRSLKQRDEIATQFKQDWSYELRPWLFSEISGWFRTAIEEMMAEPYEMLAKDLHWSMKGAGTNEQTLIDILVPATQKELTDIHSYYEQQTETWQITLLAQIEDDTSGDFRLLLRDLSAAKRPEDGDVDEALVQEDVKIFHNGGRPNFKQDGILTSRSWAHLKRVFVEFEKVAGRTVKKAIEDTTSGWYATALKAIDSCAMDMDKFFADRLKESSTAKDYRSLARITVWRSEIDLNRIKFVYKKKHGVNAGNDIWGATTAEFRDTLMALMRASPPVGGEENEENEDQTEKKSESNEENMSLNRDAMSPAAA